MFSPHDANEDLHTGDLAVHTGLFLLAVACSGLVSRYSDGLGGRRIGVQFKVAPKDRSLLM